MAEGYRSPRMPQEKKRKRKSHKRPALPPPEVTDSSSSDEEPTPKVQHTEAPMSRYTTALHPGKMFTGFFAPVVTPVTKEGDLNLSMVDKFAQCLIEDGVSGIFLTGTSGESKSLTVKERKKLIEAWSRAVGSGTQRKLKIIAYIGANCIEEAQELAAYAEGCGVDGIAAMAPCFFQTPTAESLTDWLAEIAKAASSTPFLYYHFPAMTNCKVPVYKLFSAAHKRIPTLKGAKFTDGDMQDLGRCIQYFPNLEMLPGFDNCMLPALSQGARGFIYLTVCATAPLYHQLLKAFDEGRMNEALQCQQKVNDYWLRLENIGGSFINQAKHIIAWRLGYHQSSDAELEEGGALGPPRLPMTPLPAPKVKEMRASLEEWGFRLNANRGSFQYQG